MDSPEAIAKWIEERKKKWPSAKVVEVKVCLFPSAFACPWLAVDPLVSNRANNAPNASRQVSSCPLEVVVVGVADVEGGNVEAGVDVEEGGGVELGAGAGERTKREASGRRSASRSNPPPATRAPTMTIRTTRTTKGLQLRVARRFPSKGSSMPLPSLAKHLRRPRAKARYRQADDRRSIRRGRPPKTWKAPVQTRIPPLKKSTRSSASTGGKGTALRVPIALSFTPFVP